MSTGALNSFKFLVWGFWLTRNSELETRNRESLDT